MHSTVAVYYATGNKRSELIATSAMIGLRAIGEKPVKISSIGFTGDLHKYAVFYGLCKGLHRIFEAYKAAGVPAIYVDLGYWRRRIRNRYDGHHKMCVSTRHPVDYFQNKKHSSRRFKSLGLAMRPWIKKGRFILVAGMSAKAAEADGMEHTAWERAAIATIRDNTDMPIVYRPKPNCLVSKPLPGASFDKNTSLHLAYRTCHAVVTCRSNVGVDALLNGVPVFSSDGVAAAIANADLASIEEPYYPSTAERLQWASDVAWTQFTTYEIQAGLPFKHLKEEGLIP